MCSVYNNVAHDVSPWSVFAMSWSLHIRDEKVTLQLSAISFIVLQSIFCTNLFDLMWYVISCYAEDIKY